MLSKRKNIKLICILVLTMNFSCMDMLDLQPKGNVNGEQVWGTAKGCENMLMGAYSRIRRTLIQERPMYLYGDLPSNMVFIHNHWIPAAATSGKYDGAYLREWWLDWRPYFQTITTTTTLLKHINDVPISEFGGTEREALIKRNKLRGEAYFLYAFTYFYMVRIYGDLPLVKEAFETSGQGIHDGSTIPRKQSPEKEILKYLIKNLDAAITLIGLDTPGSSTWAIRADVAAAMNLKAHVLLWLARDLDSNSEEFIDYVSQAEELLNLVITQCGRSLVDYNNPKAVVDMFDGQSTEGIFELNISVADKESFLLNYGEFSLHSTTYHDISRKSLTNLTQFMVPDLVKSTNLYPLEDKRRELFFQNFGHQSKDYDAPPFLLKYAANIEDDPATPEYYFANSNVLIFRLSESILLRAEALAKLGRYGNAKELLNLIKSRAGIDPFLGGNDQLIAEIIKERARELAGEGHSAYDRIRNNYWDGCGWMTPERFDKKGYYWPVDLENLLSANPDLYQVPFWVGKL